MMKNKIVDSFPAVIRDFIGNSFLKEISIGRSGDAVYELSGISNYILKISKDIKRLEYEKEIFEWLNTDNKLPVPEVLLWYKTKEYGYLVTKKIRGKMLCDEFFIKRPKKLIKIIDEVINLIENVNIDTFPYQINKEKKVFSHGDLCLPNIIIRNNKIVGFIDLGDASIRDKEYDVATILRSYEYNINSLKYSKEFLETIKNIDIEKVMKYYPDVFG